MNHYAPETGKTWTCNACGTVELVAGAFMTIGPVHMCHADQADKDD